MMNFASRLRGGGCSAGGAIQVSVVQYDLDVLIEEIKDEVEKSRSISMPLKRLISIKMFFPCSDYDLVAGEFVSGWPGS